MPISDTNFFNSYQSNLGYIYSRGYQEVYNPASTLIQFENSRQLLLQNFGISEVSNGLSIVNVHLSSESTYNNAASTIVKNVISTFNSTFNTIYGVYTRDYFNALTSTSRIPWTNPFKNAWFQATNSEVVHQIGFATYNGSSFVFYPNISPITATQSSAQVSSVSGNNASLTGYGTALAAFALPGYYIIGSSNSNLNSFPSITLGTTVVGYANTTTLILSGPVGVGSTVFAFRPLQNPEYLEFRYASAGVTGIAATYIFSDITLNVNYTTATGTGSTAVTISAANTTGRTNIGIYGNTAYKALTISSITINSGTPLSLGTNQSLEIWVKSTY